MTNVEFVIRHSSFDIRHSSFSMPSLLSQTRTKEAQAALDRGVAWLLKKQMVDGGWHSLAYGGLRDGAAVTSLAVYTFSLLPGQVRADVQNAVDSAAKFLEAGFEKRRTIASPDGSLDYPTYATALILTAARRFPSLLKILPKEQLLEYLLTAQVNAARGFEKDSPDYGGWDLLGSDDASGISTGTNVSVTSYALEALSQEKSPAAKAARELALAYLARAQKATGDGGFAFTAEAGSLNNKAQWRDTDKQRPRSYGSPTCDGIQALLHCGVAKDDERIEQSVNWLVDHPSTEIVPGFDELPAELGWRDGLKFYFAQSFARVLHLLPEAVALDRADKLARWLVKEQSGGLWQNKSSRMREDDPLIATSLALTALAAVV
jgi:hypothetical protein